MSTWVVVSPRRFNSHNVNLNLDQEPIVGTEAQLHDIGYVGVLEKSKAACADGLSRLVEGEYLWLGHDGVVL